MSFTLIKLAQQIVKMESYDAANESDNVLQYPSRPLTFKKEYSNPKD